MPEAESRDLLSREELAALLQELQTDRPSTVPFPETASARLIPLARILGEFSEDHSRAMSTLHQRKINLSLLEVVEMTMRDFAALLLPTDRLLCLRMEPEGHDLYMLLGRPFVFGWMALAFGAKESTPIVPVVERHYTRIEERFLRRAGGELVRQLETVWSFRSPVKIEVTDLIEPESLRIEPQKWAMASFDMLGLGDLCRLRLLVPPGLFGAEVEEEDDADRERVFSSMRAEVLEMKVKVRVEAGHAQLALLKVAQLKVGDLIPLEPAESRGLVVFIEDEAKYVAVPGRVGKRLAVQLAETL